MSGPLVQWYRRIQQSWMAVSNKAAATIGNSERHSQEEAHGAGSRQKQVHRGQRQQGPVLVGQESRVSRLLISPRLEIPIGSQNRGPSTALTSRG